jgi:histidinol-phosphate/aromatic aminotransferase/cobyric acid decarboxylase-like protein
MYCRIADRLRAGVETDSNDLAALWASIAAQDAAVIEELERQAGPEKEPPEEFFVLVRCADEKEQVALLKRFRKEGLQCEAKLS